MILDGNLFNHVLRGCSAVRSLNTTKTLHAFIIKLGQNVFQPFYLTNNVISQYASLDELYMAHKVFDRMPQRNVVSYNTIIGAYSRCGDVEEAWRLFTEMMWVGLSPNQFTLGSILSCPSLDYCRGVQLQALASKNGTFVLEAFVGTALLGVYGRRKAFGEVARVFEDMPNKSLVTWNSMLSLFGHHGLVEDCTILFRDLLRMQASLSGSSFVAALTGLDCERDLELGEQLHSLVIKNGFDFEVSVGNSLINMYSKCAGMSLVVSLFEELPVKDVVTYNTVIGALTKDDRALLALDLFLTMSEGGILPNQTTFANIVVSCTSLQTPIYGEFIHTKIIKQALDSDAFVGSALIDFYAKSDKLEEAHQCFFSIYDKNVICWNALILGYANKGSSTSMSLLLEMLRLGYRPSEFSFSAVLRSSSMSELQQLHCMIIRLGYQNNEYVSSSLITMYAKNGCISDALIFITSSGTSLGVVPSNNIASIYNKIGQYHEVVKLLSVLEEPDVISWNIVIAACARNGDYSEVFELFKHMHMVEIRPDNYTFVSLLSACSKLCDLALGRSIHGLILKFDFNRCDTFLCNVMIDMYGKCGSVESSVDVFDQTINRNLVTWTALISALGINGYAHDALGKFRKMEFLGLRPDKVAFLAVLTACRHGGLVREGMELFGQMRRIYEIEPEMDHYNCLVNLLARCGHLKEAEQIIGNMPFPPNALVWRSFLEGCKRQRTAEDQIKNRVAQQSRISAMV
ncbi:pentatricopeptide repeat-containing protein [Tripterygium wilfordii]|uniref:Pentatricopeptide repeat-containing protein n=1 Tax=Tripterygium wilfordii TaxID=458696 RepID=A0A7J7CEL7_TRIWF|nr:pentatricopeptide repeat-containing protein At3g58590 [Tripterygium wilfordii]XP_038681232.1 pentatricopeptide repeat-containing protein At3g58590 [Tripterygium wilfordii]KAF5732601.1 pentatricopeptide repeat-containing protein [Tripterygium wilfordii]